jgi:hypothetical protein
MFGRHALASENPQRYFFSSAPSSFFSLSSFGSEFVTTYGWFGCREQKF